MQLPQVSVCIPAYKNTSFLDRVLQSLVIQTFSNFEVIVTDDSPDNSVELFLKKFEGRLLIKYYKNNPALGTPANWNFAMKQARGTYIKLIHDDDWFASEDALEILVNTLEMNNQANFVFCAYNNIDVEAKTKQTVIAHPSFLSKIKQDALHLYTENIIGPPSVIMHRNLFNFQFDEHLKWVVDFEAYMRSLQKGNQFVFIDKPLVNIGISSLQVTKASSRIREVEIPENFYMLIKQGIGILNKIWVFDYYWRLLRNVGIRSENDIIEAGWVNEIPVPISRMIQLQKNIPLNILKVGVLSKFFMGYCFITRGNIDNN